jgi:hypothetical protein
LALCAMKADRHQLQKARRQFDSTCAPSCMFVVTAVYARPGD